jgi:hypothetical protein
MPTFCDQLVGQDACSDFDSPLHSIGNGWSMSTVLNGGTTGMVTVESTDFFSCPSAAEVDVTGVAGGHSYVQLAHSVILSNVTTSTFIAEVKRTGPGGVAPDGPTVFQAFYTEPGSVLCQVLLQLFDSPSPSAELYLQDNIGAGPPNILTSKFFDLASPTANAWTSIQVVFDLGVAQTVTVTVAGATQTIPLAAPCNVEPATLTAGWGVSFDDRTQTVFLDNVSAAKQ